jgi:hypothetical protein
MGEIVPAECDDLSVTFHGGQVVFVAVVAQESLHEPRFSVVGVDVENPIEKDLGNVPAFFRDCAGDVPSVDANHGVVTTGLVV